MTRIPASRKTQLVEDRAKQIRANSAREIAQFKADGGGMIGDKKLAPDPRLNAYWQSVTLPDGSIDMHDVSLIMPDEQGRFVTELQIRNGLSTDMPHSPTWVNFLRIPDMFTEKARDFVHLNQLDVERQKHEVAQGSPQGPAPLSPGLGPPVPVAATAGPPQPNGGGSPLGYGAPQ